MKLKQILWGIGLLLCTVHVAQGQTYTFKCLIDAETMDADADSCEGCGVWRIDSRSFAGLLIYADSIPALWIEAPYTLKVRGDTVDIWEHTSPPSRLGRNMFFPDRISIRLAQTNFATIQDFVDSTFCAGIWFSGSGTDTTALFYASDSLNHAPIFRGDTLMIVGRGAASVTFDSLTQKYVVNVDSVSGGTVAANNGVSDNEDGGKIRLGNRYMTSPDAPFTMDRKINLDGRMLHIGDLSDSSTLVVDGLTDNVGIKTPSPFRPLEVNGGIRIGFIGEPPNSIVTADADGDIIRTKLSSGFAFSNDTLVLTGTYWLQNGNTLGTALIGGTNDNNETRLETNNVTRFTLSSGASTGGAMTLTDVTSKTNTVEDIATLRTNSTGTAASSFGSKILFQLESSTTDNQDAGGFGTIWTTATHASRTSADVLYGVNNAGAIGEVARFQSATAPTMSIASAMGTAGTTTYANAGIANGVAYIIGNTANKVTVGNSTGLVEIGSQAVSAQAIQIQANANSMASSVTMGGVGLTLTAGTKQEFIFGSSYLPTSGTGVWNTIVVNGRKAQTGGANGIIREIFLAPGELGGDAVADYRAIDFNGNLTNMKFLYQSGANVTNLLVGKTNIGALTAPVRQLDVTGEVRITDLTTDTPTRIVGADADGDLDDITIGSGLDLTGGVLSTSGGAPIVAANNGLSLSGTTVQWGGNPLIKNTSIDQDGFYYVHTDGKRAFSRYNGNPFTDVNVTSSVDITGKGLAPSTSITPSEDNILCLRGHDGSGTYYGNAMFFGTYATATLGSWIKTRNEGAYTTYYPLNLNPNGGKLGVGRNPVVNALDAYATITGTGMTGSGITGSVLHIEAPDDSGYAKATATFCIGTDIVQGEVGYFGTDVVRLTNRNTQNLSSAINFAIGGETSDRMILLSTTALSNARLGVGFNNTTDLTSTLLSKGSLGAAALSTSGAPTFDETKFFVVYTAAGNQTYTLPAQADCKGRIFWIQNNSSAGVITFSANIKKANGASFNTLDPGQFAYFISDGAEFFGFKQTSL